MKPKYKTYPVGLGTALHAPWLLLFLALMNFSRAKVTCAQAAPSTTLRVAADSSFIMLYVDGQRVDWPEGVTLSQDLQSRSRWLVGWLQGEGHYLAQIDSVRLGEGASAAALYATRGPRIPIGELTWAGAARIEPQLLAELTTLRTGSVFHAPTLESDISAVLAHYERQGYPLARIAVEHIQLMPSADEEDMWLDVTVRVDEGPQVRLAGIKVDGLERTQPDLIRRAAGVEIGGELTTPLAEIREGILATGLFTDVGTPMLLLQPDGQSALLQVEVAEESPGAFDLVLGYQPRTTNGTASGLVGNGHLMMRNLFGHGRFMSLRLHRLPGQISRFEALVRDPYVANTSVQIEAGFEGIQQDSTYGQQAYEVGIGYPLNGALELLVTWSREVTRPGQSGVQLFGGRQLIARADAWYAGLTVRYRRVDNPVSPSRGLDIETRFDRGRKERSRFELGAAGDTVAVRTAFAEERLRLRGRFYIPVFARQVLVLGGESFVLLSDSYDVSDLFRMGGAASLRGYDEDQFRGRLIGRVFTETRYRFERSSYAYLFFDLGYIDRPVVNDLPARREFHSGYGFGVQLQTGIGLINTSFGIPAGDPPSQGKVHIGLSVGL